MDMNVLVADASAGLRADVSRMLAGLRCRVVAEAEDGASALSAFDVHQPDIAVLAVDLPGMSGATAARRLADGSGGLAVVVPCPELVVVLADRLLASDDLPELLDLLRQTACPSRDRLH